MPHYHNMEAHHPHSDPTATWRDVAESIGHYRPEWASGVVGFSANVDGVDAPAKPGIDR